MFEGCRLTPDCLPDMAAIGFYRDSQKYYMFLDRRVIYKGDHPPMMHLCSQDPVFFRQFSHLQDFFRELPSDTPPSPKPASRPKPPKAPPQEDYDINHVANLSEVSVRESKTRTAPDRKAIQRELEKIIMGQKTATETIAHQAALFLSKKNPQKPLSIMTYGPPGTGKTESAKALAAALSKLGPNRYGTVLLDLNQFTESHSVSRLVGAPPSYVGFEEPGALETIAQQKYTVAIFDELDKAHPEVLKTLMSVLDTGKCSSNRRQEDGSNELDLRHAILFFTSNFHLDSSSSKRKIGFSLADDVTDIQCGDDVEVCYAENEPKEEQSTITQRIYRNTEAARKSFVDAGNLQEIASRFQCFCEFKELSAEAKIQVLVKMIVEAGFEYNVKLAHINSPILQALIDAATTENVLTVRSYKAVVEGNLAEVFATAGETYAGQSVRLTGTIESPIIKP